MKCLYKPTHHNHSQCYDVTISLSNAEDERLDLGGFSFDNYYSHSLTIQQAIKKDKDSKILWCSVLENKILMRDCHSESDAQNKIIIYTKDFNQDVYQRDAACAFRFIIKQPSPNWKVYELRNITCFPLNSKDTGIITEDKVIERRSPFAWSLQTNNSEMLNSSYSNNKGVSIAALLSKQCRVLREMRMKEDRLFPTNQIKYNEKIFKLVISNNNNNKSNNDDSLLQDDEEDA